MSQPSPSPLGDVVALLVVAILIVGLCALYGQCVYRDPSCGFAHCVKVK